MNEPLTQLNQRYTWLLFDADGTLFDYDRAEATALELTFRRAGLAYDATYLATYQQINQQLWQELEAGQTTPELLRVRRFELLFGALGIAVSPEPFSLQYLAHLAMSSHLMEGALETLQALHGAYRLAILTNGLRAVQRPRLQNSAIHDFVSAMIISEEVGVAKPAAGIFDIAFERMGHPPKSRVLMIGDSLTSDMQGGCTYGIDTCWYNPRHLPRPADLPITYEIGRLAELKPLLLDSR